MKKDKFNLSEEEYERELKNGVIRCRGCGCADFGINVSVGPRSSNRINVKCGGCGREVEEALKIEGIGCYKSLATPVTRESITKSFRSVIKKYRRLSLLNWIDKEV